MKNFEYKKYFSKWGFFTYKNLRKDTIETIKKEYSNITSHIEGEYKGYKYFIVWKKEEGIHSYIFENNRVLVEHFDYYNPYKEEEKKVKRFIHHIIGVYKHLNTQNNENN